jgi:Ca2+-binding EF-hand superfamily protein
VTYDETLKEEPENMSDTVTSEDDFTARRAARAARSARVEEAKAKVTPEQESAHKAAPAEAAKDTGEIDISGNPIHQVIEDGSLDNDAKIQKIAAYLTAEASDYPEARKRFAEFEAYCAYTQSESMKIDVRGIEKLIEEVKGSLKPEVEQIAANLTQVQTGILTSKDLLNVLHEARSRGQTLEDLTSAFRENEALVGQLAALQQKIESLAKNEEGLKIERKTAEESKRASETGFVNSLARAFTGPDKSIAAAIAYLESQLESNSAELAHTAEQKAKLAAERDQKLESGPLRILRTVDATEKGFSENLVNTANSCLRMISDSTSSVQRLIQRTAFSDEQARLMNDAIAKAAFRELILKKSVVQVMDSTRQQAQDLLNSLNQVNADVARVQAEGRSTTELEVKQIQLEQQSTAAKDYEDILGRTAMQFDVATANSAGAQAQAQQLSALIQQEKDVLKGMSGEALPTTTRALRLTLNQALALHTHEISSTVNDLIEKARQINDDSMQRLVETERDLHKQEVDKIKSTIEALDSAAELMAKQLEANAQATNERMGVMTDLSDAADGLNQAVQALTATRPGVVRSNAEAASAPVHESQAS